MSPYYKVPDELRQTLQYQEPTHGDHEWHRWDEKLVEEFGRWLGRLAKAFAIISVLICAAITIAWFLEIY